MNKTVWPQLLAFPLQVIMGPHGEAVERQAERSLYPVDPCPLLWEAGATRGAAKESLLTPIEWGSCWVVTWYQQSSSATHSSSLGLSRPNGPAHHPWISCWGGKLPLCVLPQPKTEQKNWAQIQRDWVPVSIPVNCCPADTHTQNLNKHIHTTSPYTHIHTQIHKATHTTYRTHKTYTQTYLHIHTHKTHTHNIHTYPHAHTHTTTHT